MTEEAILVSQIKAGDQAAFEQLVTRFEGKIYNMGLRYTGNPQDAMDICQEVFLRVYRFVGNFSQESQISTWIYRISANVCKDFIAKKGRSTEIPLEAETDAGALDIEISDMRFSPEAGLEASLLKEAIVDGILALPEKYRQVIIMRDINGLAYDEIGAALQLEEGTVKSRISRGRERLRRFLIDSGNNYPGHKSNVSKGGIADA